ncbi:TPA: hypothetical protein VBA43_001764 [Streptococcus agalactiae]|uniref:hypothetical protein n=1 Tax=Streptococcus agalactiae TaxID=1311 RepID=UPI0015675FEF|nr:hypothetical protein [Streptococcus agalactiae]HEO6626482.1 hypothetical protein [Streptococcus agalactiae]
MENYLCYWEKRGQNWYFLANCENSPAGRMFNLVGAKFKYCPFCGRRLSEVTNEY